MKRSSYFRSKSEMKPDLTMRGSLTGTDLNKVGEIDVSLSAEGGKPGIRHTITATLSLEEAESFARSVLEEVSEVRFHLENGYWRFAYNTSGAKEENLEKLNEIRARYGLPALTLEETL